MDERKLNQLQYILDRSDGDIAKALTYAAFRRGIVSVIQSTWPNTTSRDNAEVTYE